MNVKPKAEEFVDLYQLKVHPSADLFPMLSEEELLELANDISENGLREPIVIGKLNGEDVIVDGRNRLAACRLVEVEPAVRHLNGEDIDAYILSTNITRRHLTAGQRAICYAKLVPASKGGRGNKVAPDGAGLPRMNITRARKLVGSGEHPGYPDLAHEVMAGTKYLNVAYEEAKMRERRQAISAEDLEYIRVRDQELYEKVQAGSLSPSEARREYENLRRQMLVNRDSFWKGLKELGSSAGVYSKANVRDSIDKYIDPRDVPDDVDLELLLKRLSAAIETIRVLIYEQA